MKNLILCALFLLPVYLHAQTITKFAGIDSSAYTGDGGPATAAGIYGPASIAIDPSGNVYITDQTGYMVIRKINPSGIITTIAGTGVPGYNGDGGPASAAQLYNPADIKVDRSGNIIFCDYNNQRVRKIDASGIISTIAGTGTAGYSGDGGPATAAQLHDPMGLAFDSFGNIYVCDNTNYVIRKIDSSGIISTIAGTGIYGYSGDGGPATMAMINGNAPNEIGVDNFGNIYFEDAENYRIRKINASGIITTIAGDGHSGYSGDGGPAVFAEISDPGGLIVDSIGNIYFSDYGNARIRMINTEGNISTVAGNGVQGLGGVGGNATLANLDGPYGLFFDVSHNLYVCNYGSGDISKISTSKLLSLNFYYDANSNCVRDSGEPLSCNSVVMEVDSNGVAIDTLSTIAGISYFAKGNQGDIYTFKVLSIAGSLYASCPASGIVTDTILSSGFYSSSKDIGLSCSGSSGFDLIESVYTQAGNQRFQGDILINNTYCNSQNAVFTANISPKYGFQSAYPAPSSIVGNTVTWNQDSLSAFSHHPHIHFTGHVPGVTLSLGDTIHSDYMVSPLTGDVDPSNNNCIKVDTVKGSLDPNEMTVTPAGLIASGTTLQYYAEFENDGNDTAKNIYVLDTLSNYLDAGSLRVQTASATLNTTIINSGGYRVVKFDFPGINLLDSTHHDQCTGMVIFTIKTKTGLPDGTLIPNDAGIYFDDNAVVMTNGVTNIIGSGVTTSLLNAGSTGKLELFPNPAHDEIKIVSAEIINTLSICNFMGQTVYTGEYNSKKAGVDISFLRPGVYFVKVNGTEVKKFVKQ